MAPKLPLPRGWKRRVRSSVLRIRALVLPPVGTTDLCTAHVDQYTKPQFPDDFFDLILVDEERVPFLVET